MYRFTPVAWGFRGMNIRIGPFPLCGAMASSPATKAPSTHASAHCLLHLASSLATLGLAYQCTSQIFFSG